MTTNPPKKAAEGPFRIKRLDCFGGPSLMISSTQICRIKDSQWFCSKYNSVAIRYLKTPSGKRWMEENGVGGSR